MPREGASMWISPPNRRHRGRARLAPGWWSRPPRIDDLAKLLPLIGALLYGILFLAYRSYYTAVGVTPEDVGVTNSFVLVRSPGFILLTLGYGTALLGIIVANSRPAPKSLNRAGAISLLASVLLPALAAYYLFDLFPASTPTWVIGPLSLLLAFTGAFTQRFRRSRYRAHGPAVAWIVVILFGVALPAVAVIQQAAHRGQLARAGETVAAYDIFSVPIVDVAAPRITLMWADANVPHPRDIFGSGEATPVSGVLLGQGDGFIVVNVPVGAEQRVVRLDPSTVIVELD
jgi:hypothetical protein